MPSIIEAKGLQPGLQFDGMVKLHTEGSRDLTEVKRNACMAARPGKLGLLASVGFEGQNHGPYSLIREWFKR